MHILWFVYLSCLYAACAPLLRSRSSLRCSRCELPNLPILYATNAHIILKGHGARRAEPSAQGHQKRARSCGCGMRYSALKMAIVYVFESIIALVQQAHRHTYLCVRHFLSPPHPSKKQNTGSSSSSRHRRQPAAAAAA